MTDDADKGPDAIRKALETAEEVEPFDYSSIAGDTADKAARRDGKGKGQNKPTAETAGNDNASVEGFEDDPGGFGPNMPPDDIARARECAELDQNDRDNARRLIIWFGLDLAYVAGMGWLTWRGTHWQRDEGELRARLMAQTIVDRIKLEEYAIDASPAQARLLAAADAARGKNPKERSAGDTELLVRAKKVLDQLGKKRDARRKFAVSSGNAGKTKAMLEQAASHCALDAEELDADRYSFNVRNGTLRFRKVADPDNPDADSVRYVGEFDKTDHARDDRITKLADVAYDPEATCPKWRAYIERAHPEPAMQRFLQVFYGKAVLVGGNGDQKLLYNYGPGGEGKSTLSEVLGRLAGSYRATVSPDTLTGDSSRQGGQASPDIARLHNTRFVVVDELPRGVPLRENLIKAVSGGGRMLARFLMKENFEFDPIFTPVLSGNEMPEISGTDDGIWRRVLLVNWTVKIDPANKMTWDDAMAMFDAERPGILNWLIEGAMLWLAHGLDAYIPPSVQAFTEYYREERDPVGQFVSACVVRETDRMVQGKDMYEAYCRWSEANGLKPWQQAGFGRRMNALGFRKERGRLVQYLDCRLDIADLPSRFDPPNRQTDSGL